ncbi:MAG: chemotaxis protein CheW [Treponema sp.]|nr:chemotaxis protein CheW [Treponema sp.]
MNEDIIEELQENTTQKADIEEQKAMTTWLIFLISDKKYAIRSSDVVEIISDLSVYKLPFMPTYIEGVLNRRGEPFTVVNPNPIIQDNPNAAPPEKLLYMIFKRTDDQLSLHISDILLFTKIEDSHLKLIPNATEESFLLGTVEYEAEEIPVLNQNAFELLIRKDCGSN